MNGCKLKWAPACILGILLCAGHVAKALPPDNDDCYSAAQIGGVVNLAFDTRSATFDGPGLCMTSPNIWYAYTAAYTGNITVSLCGSGFDTVLTVYNGWECYPQQGDVMGCNDDACGHQSELNIDVVAGNQYLIEVGGFGGNTGQGVLNISSEGEPPSPPPSPPSVSNDNCYNARSISNVTDLPFNTTNATFDGPGHCMSSPNIWYRYTATVTGDVTVSLCGSSYDTKLAVYEGVNCPPSSSNLIECNDDFCGWQSEITFAATAGRQYLIEVGGFGSSKGQGVISISSEGYPPSPPPWEPGEPTNNNCYNATAVGNVTNLPFDTTHATPDGPGYYNTFDNIWYRYTAPYTCDVTVDLCSSSFDTVIIVYDGWDCTPTFTDIIARDDDSCGLYGLRSKVTFAAIAGHHYLIEIGGATGSDWGPGVMTISCEGGPPPWSNDNCYNARSISNVTDLPFNTTGATFDGPGHCMSSPNIWYRYTATGTGDVTVSLCGSSYDTKLAVYNRVNCPPSQSDLIECNDDFCGWQSEITFAATAGRQYLIEVGGFGSSTGQGMISVSFGGGVPPTKALDLGDAPDSSNNFSRNMTAYPKGGPSGVRAYYPTVFNDASGAGPYGPVHLNPQAVAHLGSIITNEAEADIGQDQDGINNIGPQSNSPDRDRGDDGVIFPVNMPKCRWTTFDYFVNIINPGTGLWVNVWCDWNRDGDWDDDSNTNPTLACSKGFVSEWVVRNQYLFNLPAGLNQLTTPAFLSWHPMSGRKEIWMRLTLSERLWTGGSNPGSRGNSGSGPQTGYEYGETEDYYFTPKTSYTACEDFNGDGVINLADLATFTSDWLENCPQ